MNARYDDQGSLNEKLLCRDQACATTSILAEILFLVDKKLIFTTYIYFGKNYEQFFQEGIFKRQAILY